MANGYIPDSARGSIPGSNAGLLKGAALAYTAMHYASVDRYGVSLAIIDGQVGRTYRSYARQLLAKRIYGSNAAYPGTSNHGLALAVDLMTSAQRRAIDGLGRAFGWAKAWSDASWEWWHLKWRSGIWAPKPDLISRIKSRKTRKIAYLLAYHRRRAIEEASTGKGRRYRRAIKWRSRYRHLLLHRLHKTSNPGQRGLVARVLNDRTGHP